MAALSLSRIAPVIVLYFLGLPPLRPPLAAGVDVVQLLSHFPNLSSFASLLSKTSVAGQVNDRTSLTILAVSNSDLDFGGCATSALTADVLSRQILVECISPDDINGTKAIGRTVNALLGTVNITSDGNKGVSIRSAAGNASVRGNFTEVLHNVSVFSVKSLLVPCGFDQMASESSPPPGMNITKALEDAHEFNVAAAMLAASGVVEEFEGDGRGAGLSIFMPTDAAFADAAVARVKSLPAVEKAVVLKFHVLHSYYPLGSLESIVNPVQPTLATEGMGAGSFTVNISRVNGSLCISTGIVQAAVTQTVFDQNPISIFGVSTVLLPPEIFGKDSKWVQPPDGPPLSPDSSPSGVPTPPESRDEIRSGDTASNGHHRFSLLATFMSCCIGLYSLV